MADPRCPSAAPQMPNAAAGTSQASGPQPTSEALGARGLVMKNTQRPFGNFLSPSCRPSWGRGSEEGHLRPRPKVMHHLLAPPFERRKSTSPPHPPPPGPSLASPPLVQTQSFWGRAFKALS